MMKKLFYYANFRLIFLAVSASYLLVPSVQASNPKDALKCTTAAKTTWVSEAKIREVFEEKKYTKVFFKVSRGNCYEFYAIGKDNSIVEAYYDPVTAEPLRFNRVTDKGNEQLVFRR